MKILFQGDSITDAGRDRADGHQLGHGYPSYAADFIRKDHPDREFEFINLGISGNQTKDLVARLQTDFVDIQPDIMTLMIGINDVWHHAEARDWIPNEVFEERYRTVLTAMKEKTHAKILLIEPYITPVADKAFFRVDLDPKIHIIRRLAREYADAYLPTDGLLASAYLRTDPMLISEDGVHPAKTGAEIIGRMVADYIKPLIEG